MVIAIAVAEFPGVTVDGLKVTVEPVGCPVAANEMRPLKAPPAGVTVRLTLAEPPAATVTGGCGALIVKVEAVVTVKVRGDEVDSANSAFPEYAAVMLLEPAGRVLVAKVAPPEELTFAVFSNVELL